MPGARVGRDVAASGWRASHPFVLFGKGKKGLVKHMRFSDLTIAVAMAAFLAAGDSFAADLEIAPRLAPEDISVHKGPPNCSRWTDECVNCSRGAEGEAPVCSNIGFACQPKPVRCLSPAVPGGDRQKK